MKIVLRSGRGKVEVNSKEVKPPGYFKYQDRWFEVINVSLKGTVYAIECSKPNLEVIHL